MECFHVIVCYRWWQVFFFYYSSTEKCGGCGPATLRQQGAGPSIKCACVRACLFMHAHVHTYRGSSKCAVDAVFLLGWQEFKPPYF